MGLPTRRRKAGAKVFQPIGARELPLPGDRHEQIQTSERAVPRERQKQHITLGAHRVLLPERRLALDEQPRPVGHRLAL